MPVSTTSRALTFAAVLALMVGVVVLYQASARANGMFVFPLDDSYIHLAIARTLAEHGTWGINPGEFASATSSPLYTAILALALVVLGPHHQVSLALNVVAGAAICVLAGRFAHDRRSLAAVLAFLIVAGPLPYLAALGMEHLLHAALVLGIAKVGLSAPSPRRGALLALLVMAGVLTRYETVFLLAPLAYLHVQERRWTDALVVSCAGAFALLGYGAWSMAHGALPLPNSLVMKSALVGGWGRLWRDNLYEGGPVLVLIAGVAAASATAAVRDARFERHAVLFGVTALIHLAVAKMGWLYRYEGYLVIWGGVLALPPLLSTVTRGSQRVLLTVILVPCGFRAWQAFEGYVPCSKAIHDNDVVLARMVARDLPDATIAVHNIGALAWFTDATIVDVAGLATTEVTRLHLTRKLTGAAIGELLVRRGVQYSYTDTGWLASDLPPGLHTLASLSYETPVPGRRATTRLAVTQVGDPAVLTRALDGIPPGGEHYRVEWPP